jgi:hypothetical protein
LFFIKNAPIEEFRKEELEPLSNNFSEVRKPIIGEEIEKPGRHHLSWQDHCPLLLTNFLPATKFIPKISK